jgi:hypothetical protein
MVDCMKNLNELKKLLVDAFDAWNAYPFREEFKWLVKLPFTDEQYTKFKQLVYKDTPVSESVVSNDSMSVSVPVVKNGSTSTDSSKTYIIFAITVGQWYLSPGRGTTGYFNMAHKYTLDEAQEARCCSDVILKVVGYE